MLNHLKYRFNFWTLLSLFLGAILLAPIIFILGNGFLESSPNWQHFSEHLLLRYVFQTIALVGCVVFFSGVIGVGLAWLVSQYNFLGKSFFEWLLIMPLAIPTYIMAYAYVGMLNFAAQQQWIPLSDFKTFYVLVVLLSLALYPYIYTLCKVAFSVENKIGFEAAKTMGKNKWQIFFKVALPLSSTAIIGGMSLTAMELLNDYGAVKYFGLETLTVGIFRTWNSMGDLALAIRISFILLLIVLVFLGIEKWQKFSKKRKTDGSTKRPIIPEQLFGIKQIAAFSICFIVLLAAFLLPAAQLIYWASKYRQQFDVMNFLHLSGNTFLVATLTAIFALLIGIVFQFSIRWHHFKPAVWMVSIASSGYALPGAVIGMGVLIPALFIDRILFDSYSLLNYSILFLVFAYLVRFMAVANHSLQNNFQKIGSPLSSVSKTLGKNGWYTLRHIHLPLSKSALSSAFLLVFVEVIKELPLTLIIRPFNFNTLSTQCFELANDERVAESGIYALIIILVGMLPIFVLHQLQKTKA